MGKFLKFLLHCILAISGGVALYFTAPNYNLWFLAFPSLMIFCYLATKTRLLQVIWGSFLWSFSYLFLLFSWAKTAAQTEIAQVALSVVESIFYVLLGVLIWGIWNFFSYQKRRAIYLNSLLFALSCGLAWAVMEQLRSLVPFGGMPWGNLAFNLTDSPLLNLAPYGSTQLINITAVSIAALLYIGVTAWKHLQVFTGISLLVTALVAFSTTIFVTASTDLGATRKVLIVQGNVPASHEYESQTERARMVTEKHVAATLTALPAAVDLILWPESASDLDIRTNPDIFALLQPVLEQEIPLLLGTQSYSENSRTNDYVVVTKDGVVDSYSKQHPVPFGEYLPWRELITKIVPEAAKISIDMLPGQEKAVLSVPQNGDNAENLSLATPICFEVAYDDIVASAAQEAQLLVVPTNNVTFGDSGEPWQQFAMTKLRAKEHGISAIQVSTTGVSGVVNPDGVVTATSSLFTADTQIVQVPLKVKNTFATDTYQHRKLLSYCVAVVLILLAVMGGSAHRKQSKIR